MPTAFPGIEVVTFDVGGTLLHLAEPVGWTYHRFAAVHGLELPAAAAEQAFRAAWKAVPPPPHTYPAPRPGDDRSWWRELVREVFIRCGTPVDHRFEACFAALYLHYATSQAWRPDPAADALLAACRRSFRLGIVSNFDQRLHPLLDAFGWADFFDFRIISSEHGVDKPHPAIFAKAAAVAGVPPSRMLHVGDHPTEDRAAAAEAGFQTWLVTAPDCSLTDLHRLMG